MNNGFGYFFLGVSVGAAAALLLAPKTGSETRDYLQSKAGDAAQQLKDQADQVATVASQQFERGKKMVRDQVENLSNAVDAGKHAFDEAQATYSQT